LKKIAILVAGGTGQRMKSAIPKQFLLLQGKPVLFHTMKQFKLADQQIELIVVLPKNQFDFWAKLCQTYPEINIETPHRLVEGGDTRFHSSQQGIQAISSEENCLVAIHDGVRPLVDPSQIQHAFDFAEANGNAILAVPTKDSIRKWDAEKNRFVQIPREEVQLIQTPQVFSVMDLKKAFQQTYQPTFTDDASVVESLGTKINLVPGSYTNIKITSPEDLVFAEQFISASKLN
jgi:2-C-methyl-D-erythritol 4-phosphate cytidylyltransferase